MKRLIFRLIPLTFTLSILLSLCSCDLSVIKVPGIFIDPVHEHSFSPDWSSDADYHWQEYTCQHKGDAVDKKDPHTFTPWEILKAPDCVNGGEEARECTVCGFSEKRQVSSTGHSFENPVITPPTCESDGYTTLTCSCGAESVVDTIPSLGHSMGDWYIVTEKSCTEDGITRRDCLREGCEHHEIARTDAAHEYTATVTAPTCEDKGYTTYSCSCGSSYIDGYTDATGHSITSHEKKEPTCTEVGWDAYESCSVCDYTTYVEKGKLSHTYSSEIVAPTCTEKGYTKHTCICGDSYTDSYVDSTEHRAAIDKAVLPTCTESGLTEGWHCSACGHVIVEQENVAALGHEFGDWYQVTSPTCTQVGEERRDCICGDEKKAIITFTFDDGRPSDDLVYLVFKEKGFVCNFALITDSGNYNKRKGIYLEYENNGFEILSHSATHSSMGSAGLSEEFLTKEIGGSYRTLVADGFKNIRGWVTPYSTMNSAYLTELARYYDFGYTRYYGTSLSATPYFTAEADPYQWSRVSLESLDLEDILKAIDITIKNQGFLHFYAHGFSDQLTEEELDTILDYINEYVKNGDCIVSTVSDGYDYYTHACDFYESREIEALGHEKVITDKPIQPTCEDEGLSEDAYCSVCQEILSVQTTIPARGYDWILEDGEFKILLIGNSYTEDASNCGQGVKDSQLYHIIQSMVGKDVKVTVGVIVSGGKGLNWHATKAENNTVAYTLQVTSTDNPTWKSVKRVTPAEALEWTNWDFVSLQPYSVNVSTGIESNAYPAETDSKYAHISDSARYLLDFVHEHAPSAEAYLYMHWAQTSNIALNANISYYNRMADFYPSVLDYQGEESGKRFSSLVPVGLSIQNARTTYLSLLAYNTTAYADKNLSYITDAQIGLQRDGGHVSFNIGRYIAALTFAEMVVPESLRAEDYQLPDIRITESIGKLPKEYTDIAQKSVMAAVSGWKNRSLAVTVIEGYEKDPTTIFAEKFAGGLSFECNLDADKIRAEIEKLISQQIIDDLVIEKIEIPESIQDGVAFKTTVTVRFGYTTLTFDIDTTVSVPLAEIFGSLTYVTFGDSITYGIDGVDWGKMAEPYPDLVTEALEIGSLNNLAVSGATFCKNDLGRTNMTAKILSFTGEADIISLMLGVNDFYVGLPLGTPESRDNTTIYGSLYLISEYLTDNYDSAYIFYMTPFPAKRGYTENSQGYLLEDVADAIKYVAEIYGIDVLDMYEVSEYESVEMNNPNGDGLHPSQGFMKNYAAPKISEFIEENHR